jgi:hypothetical protein
MTYTENFLEYANSRMVNKHKCHTNSRGSNQAAKLAQNSRTMLWLVIQLVSISSFQLETIRILFYKI